MVLDILGCHWAFKIGHLDRGNVSQMHFGFMDAPNQQLTINRDVDATWRPYLAIHEILHALSFMGHLQFLRLEGQLVDDEAKVDAMASLLAEVLVRNGLFNDEKLLDDRR